MALCQSTTLSTSLSAPSTLLSSSGPANFCHEPHTGTVDRIAANRGRGMRYEVVIGEDPETDDEPYRYDVFEADRGCIGSRYWTKAEAEIIAWALNAVHEGRGLLAHGHCECGEP